jgi:hypothetical protein
MYSQHNYIIKFASAIPHESNDTSFDLKHPVMMVEIHKKLFFRENNNKLLTLANVSKSYSKRHLLGESHFKLNFLPYKRHSTNKIQNN